MVWANQNKHVLPMLKIDAHQHFWMYNPVRDSWIDDSMAVIQRDFMPQDLEPVLAANGMDGCIVIQSDQSKNENMFQINNALENDFIQGVVGWIDFQNPELEEELLYLAHFVKLKGFRHTLQGEAQRNLMLTPAFKHFISLLHPRFTYDLLIFPDQLKYIIELVQQFPLQKFVLNHIAKPRIRNGEISVWAKEIKQLAACENVYCKISGMVTEANWNNWTHADFNPYLDVVVAAFGMKRLMFGSDWPVCLVAADYAQMLGITQAYFKNFSINEQEDFYGGNAIRFYGL